MIWYYLIETLSEEELRRCSIELIYNKYNSSAWMQALIEGSAIMKRESFPFNPN